jgi:hypothetical protein
MKYAVDMTAYSSTLKMEAMYHSVRKTATLGASVCRNLKHHKTSQGHFGLHT